MTKEGDPISYIQAIFMIAIALLFDIAQIVAGLLHLIPAVGTGAAIILTTLITSVGYMTFWLWFAIKGIYPLRKPRGFALFGLTFILEMLPFIKIILPGISFWVFRVIALRKLANKKNQHSITRAHNIVRVARNLR